MNARVSGRTAMGCWVGRSASLKPMADFRFRFTILDALAMTGPLLTVERPAERLQKCQTSPMNSDIVKMGIWVNCTIC